MAYAAAPPEIGQWYRDIQDRIFEVVASDDDTIEVQFYDGDVAELDEESWELLCIRQTDEPQGAIGLGLYDEDEEENMSLSDSFRPTSWDMIGGESES